MLISKSTPLTATFERVITPIQGCSLVCHQNAEDAIKEIEGKGVGLVVLHLDERADESLAAVILKRISALRLSTSLLVVSDSHQPEQTLQLLRMGAADCLCRPLDLRRLAFLIDSLTLRARHSPASAPVLVRDEPACSEPQPNQIDDLNGETYFCGSGPMTRAMGRIRKVASNDAGVLLTGETGTGKTRTARLIHELSDRRHEPFLAVNCAALPEMLVESELFGHRRGSFTGADTHRTGKFADAGAGTLFLDEIDALPLPAQAKLLRAVDERVFEPIGSNQSLKLQARLIVATNHKLEQEVDAGRFRSDLYYRLNVVEINIPPLRQRKAEVRPIAEQYLEKTAHRNKIPVARFGPGVVPALEGYDWPGNIRELRNTIERALTFCDGGEIQLDDLPPSLQTGTTSSATSPPIRPLNISPVPPIEARSTLAQARIDGEFALILQVLSDCGNNRSQAARELGISRTAFYKKLQQFQLIDTPAPL